MSASSLCRLSEEVGSASRAQRTGAGVWLQSGATQRRLDRLAAAPSTVLISGETGAGKGLIARLIHERSQRSSLGFTHVDCGALSPYLIESELFGHVRGAFTGATTARSGRFQSAGTGTIFLDEVGELDLACQRKLLRVLEDRVFERVGSAEPIAMKARVIAGTNCDLPLAIGEGRFRQDLFYRLSVTHFHVPPLRDRLDDLPELVEYALRRTSQQLGRRPPSVTADFLSDLRRHSWPGNVRELLNVIEQVIVCSPPGRPILRASDLIGLPLPWPSRTITPDAGLRDVPEKSRVAAMLIATGGNVSRAARRMGIPRSTLRYRINRAGLTHLLAKD